MRALHSRFVRFIASGALLSTSILFGSSRASAAETTSTNASYETRAESGPRGFALTAQGAYAPNHDAFGDGEGVRLGYALPLDPSLAVELGVSLVTYAGTHRLVAAPTPVTVNPSAPSPATLDSLSAMLYGADFGLHLRHGALSLKPYISAGFGWLTGRYCVGSACTTTVNDQHPFIAPGAALQITAARHYIVGLDFRYVFMPVSGENITTQAYAAFAGYQF